MTQYLTKPQTAVILGVTPRGLHVTYGIETLLSKLHRRADGHWIRLYKARDVYRLAKYRAANMERINRANKIKAVKSRKRWGRRKQARPEPVTLKPAETAGGRPYLAAPAPHDLPTAWQWGGD